MKRLIDVNNRHSAEYYNEEDNICNMENLATVEFYRSEKTGKIYAEFIFIPGCWTTTKEILPEEFNNLKSALISFSDMRGDEQ